ncbi:MAG: periplasmic heavy metal sensor [Aquimonas sp.]
MSTLSTPIRIALLVSLGLNLLLAVAAGGLWWRQRAAPVPHEALEARSLPDPRRIARALPAERRALVREALAPDRAAFAEDLRALRAAHAEVRDALRARPFEADSLATALSDVRERERAMAERVHGGLLRLSVQLTDAERAQLADSVPRRDHHHGREREREHRGRDREERPESRRAESPGRERETSTRPAE